MLNKMTTLFLCLSIGSIVLAQSGKVSGVVTDKTTKDALPGVNILVEGTTTGASTDVDGFYVIYNVPVGKQTVKFFLCWIQNNDC